MEKTKSSFLQSVHVNPDSCIACTTCTVFCPVADVTGEFVGPKMIGPAWERFRLSGLGEDKSLSYCTNCKNCEISCPQGVPIASINMVARARQCEQEHPHYLRDWIVAHQELLAHLIGPVPAGIKNWSMRNPLVRLALDGIGLAKDAAMPAYAAKRFRTQLARLSQPKCEKKVVLFPGCYMDLYDPKSGLDLVWALNRAGYEVISDDRFACCGVPMVASGFMEDAHKKAQTNVAVMREYAQQGLDVLTACPSCELMFKEEIPTFFPDVADKDMPHILDAQEFLLQRAREGRLEIELARKPERSILYHAPCHLRALGIGLPGYELLEALGIATDLANAGCCGISGSYGFKKEKRETAMKVGAELFRVVKESGAGRVATECGTCRLQISSTTGVPASHPVSILRSLARE